MKNWKSLFVIAGFSLLSGSLFGQQSEIRIPLMGVSCWSGVINQGEMMPLSEGYYADFHDNYGNQVQPMVISSDGQVIWSENPFTVEVRSDTLYARSKEPDLIYSRAGTSLREAFQFASKTYFPPAGKMPDELLFSAPQYNTWIELQYDQNQEDIIQYANHILESGFPPGVLMIDDNWQEDYGKWDFHPGRFSDPGLMMDSLHAMGFKVMLWICPFVSPDCDVYRLLESKELLMKESTGETAIVRWWNGASGELDLSNPATQQWFKNQLNFLQDEYGVDGFKLDAGDFEFYKGLSSFGNVSPNEHCELFARIGLNYPLNEYRAMWKMAGQPLVNRLRDKYHTWNDVQKLIPHILLQGMVGYNFTCPDMVGGGDFISFLPGAVMDQDLIVRSAQAHALMPMMQFSVAPWRILDEVHLYAVKGAVNTRDKYIPLIMELARSSAITGEPIVRSMEYVFPHRGYHAINDQFLLGDRILVAPYLESGEGMRTIVIPEGKWKDGEGKTIRGPVELEIKVKLDEIPIFERIK